jgi:hypothetical protein
MSKSAQMYQTRLSEAMRYRAIGWSGTSWGRHLAKLGRIRSERFIALLSTELLTTN